MRRGLISWSKAELPEYVLEARVARVQAAMAAAGIDILAVYTNPARESGVAWFTGFIPYWNQCVMLLPRTGRPLLVAGMTARVRDWIMRNAHIESVANTTKLGAEAGRLIAEKKSDALVAITDLDSVPASVVEGIKAGAAAVVDGSSLLARARAPADPTEIAFASKAGTIAHTALATAQARETDGANLVATIEGEARRQGAEEVFVALASDRAADRRFVRLEGTAALATTFAVRLSLAYKGTWVRMVRTLSRDAMLARDIADASTRFAAAIAALPRTDQLQQFAGFLVEGCRTTTPLEPLTGSMLDDKQAIAPGTVVSTQATIETNGCAIVVGAPVLVGRNGEPSSALVAPQFDQAG
jgi:Creatinase/Prolidase N-terminal domain